MVEFALLAPVLLLLIFGVFDFGRGMSANVTVTNSSREGARFAAVNVTSSPRSGGTFAWVGCPGAGSPPTAPAAATIQGAAWRQLSAASLNLNKVVIIVSFYKSTNDPAGAGATADDVFTCTGSTLNESHSSYTPATGDWVQVEVKYTFTPSSPMISNITPSISLDQTTTMVLE